METITDQTSKILTHINKNFQELSGEDCATYASRLAALLYPLRMYEAKGEGKCNIRMMDILKDPEFWLELGVKRSAVTAKAQMQSEKVFQDFWNVRALRISAEETIRTLKARVKVMLAEQHEFNG